ncbi:hypothetical protein AB833_17325 [Chromatiales bacterium (ex Bugula neritina AB1)]|nr:hypothetical protein AB833_17325 [Chromatiales bacterium (ex Bugula neritina AB1)]
MHSIREQILQEVFVRLADALSPTPVLRLPTAPVTRNTSPALLLLAESDGVAATANGRIDWLLTVRFVALAHGAQAFAITDQLIVHTHHHLMRDPNLNGLCLGITPLDCEWELEDIDNTAVAIPARFELQYRTLKHDLTSTG